MTADDRSFAPPLEIAGQLGQVIDAGGGMTPGLPRAPLPGALATVSPGLATAAVSPAPLPSRGADDPGVLALAIERLAGELLGGVGPSSAPVSLGPANWPGSGSGSGPGSGSTASNVQLPASPGIGSAFVSGAGAPPSLAALEHGADEPGRVARAIEHLARELLRGEQGAPASSLTGSAPGVPGVPADPGGSAAAAGRRAPGEPAARVAPAGSAGRAAPAASTSPGSPAASDADPVAAAIGRLAAELFAGPAVPVFTVPLTSTPAATGQLPASPWSQPSELPGLGPAFAAPAAGTGTQGVGAPAGLGSSGSPEAATSAERFAEPVDARPAASRPEIRDLGGSAFDPYAIRHDFPTLEQRVHGRRLVWLDNAATTQKPRAVIDRLTHFYEHENSNVHRGAHTLAARATDAYESARASVRRFLNAPSNEEIIFVRGATEGINLIAQSWGRRNLAAGDEIVITHLEHHANIVPWQQLCAAAGARLRVAPVDDRGDVILEDYERLLGPRTRLVAFPQVSNALGTVTPAREVIEIAHRHGAVTVLDGAQAVSHMRVDVQQLDCDFYVFSGHKVFAPTGIGAVFGKRALLDAMPPWQGGGNMIQDVTFERTTYQLPPWRFEAGTASIADAAGLGAALDYVERIGIDNIDRYEHDLLRYADDQLATVRGLAMVGAPRSKAGVLSFVLDGQRTEDVGGALDKEGIAVRSGHHCAQPILRRFGHEATVRASLAFYNTCEDIDALVAALHRLQAGRG